MKMGSRPGGARGLGRGRLAGEGAFFCVPLFLHASLRHGYAGPWVLAVLLGRPGCDRGGSALPDCPAPPLGLGRTLGRLLQGGGRTGTGLGESPPRDLSPSAFILGDFGFIPIFTVIETP